MAACNGVSPLNPLQGEFLLESSPMVPPFKPHPLPDPSDNEFPESSMIHIVISTYVADTAAYAFWMAGQLAYNVTSDKVYNAGTLLLL